MGTLSVSVGFLHPGQKVAKAGTDVSLRIGLAREVAEAFFDGEIEVDREIDRVFLELQLVAKANGHEKRLGDDWKPFQAADGNEWIFSFQLPEPILLEPRIRILLRDERTPWKPATEPIGELPIGPLDVKPADFPLADHLFRPDLTALAAKAAEVAEDYLLEVTSTESKFTIRPRYKGGPGKISEIELSVWEFLDILEEARKKLDSQSRKYEVSLAVAEDGGPMRLSEEEGRKRTHQVAEVGYRLFDQVLLRDLIDEDDENERAKLVKRIKSLPQGTRVRIESDRLALPWNVIYDREVPPLAEFGPDDVEGFWGYRYQIEEALPPTERVNLQPKRTLCVYVDPTLGERPQNDALKEVAALHRSAFLSERHLARDCSTQLVPETVEEIREVAFDPKVQIRDKIVAGDAAHMLYFFCHGQGPKAFRDGLKKMASASLKLSTLGPGHELCSEDIRNWRRDWKKENKVWRVEPVVFLNCCESGLVDPISVGNLVNDFAKFLNAQTVVGCSWEVPGRFAHEFSQDLFDRLLSRGNVESLGEILFDLRRRKLKELNPFGLVYTIFGDSRVKLA